MRTHAMQVAKRFPVFSFPVLIPTLIVGLRLTCLQRRKVKETYMGFEIQTQNNLVNLTEITKLSSKKEVTLYTSLNSLLDTFDKTH